jgi:hypothetical protein
MKFSSLHNLTYFMAAFPPLKNQEGQATLFLDYFFSLSFLMYTRPHRLIYITPVIITTVAISNPTMDHAFPDSILSESARSSSKVDYNSQASVPQ